jgi:spoIIIJ-associated protein
VIAEAFGVEDAQVTVSEDDEGGLVGAVTGGGADGLIGRGGEVIDAIQYLAAQVVSRADGGGRRRVNVDADGYRARREAALVELANRAAEEALEFGEEIELDAMTPHDRRIVHMALKERTDVVTRSEGDEPRRRIIVEPAE